MQDDGLTPSALERQHAPENGGVPVLDRDAFAALEDLAGDDDPELIAELVEIYLEDSQIRMDEVSSGAAGSEGERIGRAAHALKSSSANIGAVAFSRVCANLEKHVRSDDAVDPGELETLVQQALSMYAEVRDALGSLAPPS